MKIERPGVKGPGGAYGVSETRPTQKTERGESTQSAAQADQVSVSQKATQAAVLRTQLKETPEIRVDLVQRLKAEIAAGTYTVDAHKLAERLLKAKVLE